MTVEKRFSGFSDGGFNVPERVPITTKNVDYYIEKKVKIIGAIHINEEHVGRKVWNIPVTAAEGNRMRQHLTPR